MGEVTANEDLMREHGVIRRALLVYQEAARYARRQPSVMPLPSLLDTATLFRQFGEDYHERGLEEAYLFPVVRMIKGPVAKLPDILLAQHLRGREINDYVLRVATKPKLGVTEAEPLARALDGLALMYEHHAAREDTLIFPAWKEELGSKAYDEMGEKFEDIEQRTFGRDAFDDAVERIIRIEAAFGITDISVMTAPPPPKA